MVDGFPFAKLGPEWSSPWPKCSHCREMLVPTRPLCKAGRSLTVDMGFSGVSPSQCLVPVDPKLVSWEPCSCVLPKLITRIDNDQWKILLNELPNWYDHLGRNPQTIQQRLHGSPFGVGPSHGMEPHVLAEHGPTGGQGWKLCRWPEETNHSRWLSNRKFNINESLVNDY